MRMLIAVCPPALSLLGIFRGGYKASRIARKVQIERLARDIRDSCTGLSVRILFRKSSSSAGKMADAIRLAIKDAGKSHLPEKSVAVQAKVIWDYLQHGAQTDVIVLIDSASVLKQVAERYLAEQGTMRSVVPVPGSVLIVSEHGEVTLLHAPSFD